MLSKKKNFCSKKSGRNRGKKAAKRPIGAKKTAKQPQKELRSSNPKSKSLKKRSINRVKSRLVALPFFGLLFFDLFILFLAVNSCDSQKIAQRYNEFKLDNLDLKFQETTAYISPDKHQLKEIKFYFDELDSFTSGCHLEDKPIFFKEYQRIKESKEVESSDAKNLRMLYRKMAEESKSCLWESTVQELGFKAMRDKPNGKKAEIAGNTILFPAVLGASLVHDISILEPQKKFLFVIPAVLLIFSVVYYVFCLVMIGILPLAFIAGLIGLVHPGAFATEGSLSSIPIPGLEGTIDPTYTVGSERRPWGPMGTGQTYDPHIDRSHLGGDG